MIQYTSQPISIESESILVWEHLIEQDVKWHEDTSGYQEPSGSKIVKVRSYSAPRLAEFSGNASYLVWMTLYE